MNRIIYPTDDGGVAIIIPAPNALREVLISEAVFQTVLVPATGDQPEREIQEVVTPTVYRNQTDDEFIAWVAAKDVPAGKPFKIISTDDVPTDRTFRAAWEYSE